VPEGDTIFRTAVSLRTWLAGRIVTGATARDARLRIERLLGRTVESVEAVGKNLLITFVGSELDTTELVLHTHMMMTGSWHVYPAGATWQRPARQARVVIEAGERVAVCFNAPVVELASASVTARRSSLAGLGPDVLVEPLDLASILERALRTPPEFALGELLLDQRVVAGIGNIYRCEALHLRGLHPWTPRQALTDDDLRELIATAATLMKANLGGSGDIARDFGSGANRTWVYRRTGLPCRTCATPIEARGQGPVNRRAYWCPVCQPSP
jgi:endonuclease VIII